MIEYYSTLRREVWIVAIQYFDFVAIVFYRSERPIVTPEAPLICGIPRVVQQLAYGAERPDGKPLGMWIWNVPKLNNE